MTRAHAAGGAAGGRDACPAACPCSAGQSRAADRPRAPWRRFKAESAPWAAARHRMNAPTIGAIQRHVAAHYGLAVSDLTSTWKERRATRARHVAMWLVRALTHHGTTTIGRAFGRRDHYTLAAAWRGLERRMAADADLKEEVDAMRVSILAAGRAQADAADPTLQRLALAAFDRARIADDAIAQWRDSVTDLYEVLEARGHVKGHAPEGGAPPAAAGGPIDG